MRLSGNLQLSRLCEGLDAVVSFRFVQCCACNSTNGVSPWCVPINDPNRSQQSTHPGVPLWRMHVIFCRCCICGKGQGSNPRWGTQDPPLWISGYVLDSFVCPNSHRLRLLLLHDSIPTKFNADISAANGKPLPYKHSTESTCLRPIDTL